MNSCNLVSYSKVYIWALILTIIATSTGGISMDDCKAFLDIAEMPGGNLLMKKPSYLNIYNTCTSLLPARSAKMTNNNNMVDIPRLSDLGKSDFRRTYRLTANSFGGCAIQFYSRPHLQGALRFSRRSRLRTRPLREKSIRTVGNCCWTIYRRRRHQGEKVTLLGNTDFNTASQWGFPPGSIKSFKLNAECEFDE